MITQDALPYVLTVGNRAKSFGINVVGLERKNFPQDAIQALRQAYRVLFRSKLGLEEALERLQNEFAGQTEVARMVAFIRGSQRGVIR